MSTKLFLIAAAALFLFAFSAIAGEKGIHKSFNGTLSCAGCDLKMSEGANSQCKVYGHTHSVKLENGKYISFLENDYSVDLLKGSDWHGKKIEVTGIYYADANLLDVESFNVDGKGYSWCKGHNEMDQCHTGMHDMEKGE